MKRTCVLIPLFCFILVACGREDLDTLLENHADAVGGAEKLEAVQTLRVDLRVSEPGMEADILYRSARPGKARVDLSLDGRLVFSEGYDGSGSWQQAHGAPAVDSSPEGTAALRRGAIINMFALHELPGLGYTLELHDPTEIEGIMYHTLKLTAPDGHVSHCYLDPETLLITRRREVHAAHLDIAASRRTIENLYSDFREVDGILRPFRSVARDVESGEVLQTDEIRKIVLNAEINPDVFSKPGS